MQASNLSGEPLSGTHIPSMQSSRFLGSICTTPESGAILLCRHSSDVRPRGGHCTNGANELARRGGNAMFLVSTGRSGFDGPAARTGDAVRASIAVRCRSSAMSAGSRAIRACRWCCR